MPTPYNSKIVSITLTQWRRTSYPVSLALGQINDLEAFALGTEMGLVYLGLITPEQPLEAQLAQWRDKNHSTITPQDAPNEFSRWLERPWVLIGSDFQKRVWQALTGIPKGQTTTYKALAAAVKSPRGYQAVGQAVGANPLSILIPCHRVIRQNGDLGGYHWGLPIKQQLLAREGAIADLTG